MNRRTFLAATTFAAATTSTTASAQSGPAASRNPSNPLFQTWRTQHGLPPFEQIRPDHFKPAFEEGFRLHNLELDRIKNTPTVNFTNTIVAMENSGRMLGRAASVFYNLTASENSDPLRAIQEEVDPKFAAHRSSIYQNPQLWNRVKTLWDTRTQRRLRPEALRLLEDYRDRFIRAGAALSPQQAARVAEIDQRLSALSVEFDQKMVKDTGASKLVLETEADRAGLSESFLAGALQAGAESGLPGKHVVLNTRSSVEPFLASSSRRDLREKAWRTWMMRGDNGNENDTKAIISETVKLRAERAGLLGYRSHADFSISNQMAKTADAASSLMLRVWDPAKRRAAEEARDLQAMIAAEGGTFQLEPWDWRYYTEKVRKAKYDLNADELKPYFQLEKMIEALQYTCGQLFGLSFREIPNPPKYHPDVRAFEVIDRNRGFIGVFFADYFARPASKQSGAWMNSFRDQERLSGDVKAIVINNLNFVKAPAGQPTLLSIDDAETLFHEFGHALHGLLSQVNYPSQSGTNVPRDFVEYPSQVMEHWVTTPEILSRFAVHYRTGQPIPQALIEKVKAAGKFNQGFATTEFLASALVDMEWHRIAPDAPAVTDVRAFENAALAKFGMPREIIMRHRSTHFSHIFAGGYAAGYYAYLWSEVLDADTWETFVEKGNVFDRATALSLRQNIFEVGGSRDLNETFRRFRGRDPDVQALLRNRGFA
jgi:peptidyl-dipeptidase Dcp